MISFDDFSPVTMPAMLSPDNIKTMITCYSKLLACLELTAHDGLAADQLSSVMRYMSLVFDRMGDVSHMPHRVLYMRQIQKELTRLHKWLLTQVETEHRRPAHRPGLIPSWLASAPTEDFP